MDLGFTSASKTVYSLYYYYYGLVAIMIDRVLGNHFYNGTLLGYRYLQLKEVMLPAIDDLFQFGLITLCKF